MNKNQEKTGQRQHPRINAPALAVIEDCPYNVKNLSMGGLRVSGLAQKVKVGDCLPIELNLKLCQGKKECADVTVNTLVEIVWLSTSKNLAGAKFLNLTEFEKTLLGSALDRIAQGELALVTSDITKNTSSDASIPASFQSHHSSSLLLNKLKSKRSLYALAYLIVGGVLGFYTLRSLYDSLVNIHVRSALIAEPNGPIVAPVEPVISKERGVVDEFFVSEGMSVTPGQPLFSTRNDEIAERDIDSLKRDIQLSRLELAEAQAALQEAETLRQNEANKLDDYQAISQSELDSAQAEVEALTQKYQIAQSNLDRFSSLLQEGAVSQQDFDSVRADYLDAGAELQAAQAGYRVAQAAASSVRNGNFYDGNELISDFPDRTAEANQLRQQVQIAQQKVESLEQELNRRMQELQLSESERQYLQQPSADQTLFANDSFSVTYEAPFPGTVLKIEKLPGTPVGPRETVVVLQRELKPPVIDAYLTEAQADQVVIGGAATVLMPSTNEQYQAHITKIDRIRNDSEGIQNSGQLEDLQDKPVYIQLTIDQVSPEDRNQLLASHGVPVILDIPKSSNIFERLALWLK